MKGMRGWWLIVVVVVIAAVASWWERSRPSLEPLVAVSMRCVGMTADEIAGKVGALIEPPMKTVPDFTNCRVVPLSEAYRLELTFRRRTDAETALKNVQAALETVVARLPEGVKRDGIRIRRLDVRKAN